jgi:hypothetical protein
MLLLNTQLAADEKRLGLLRKVGSKSTVRIGADNND